MEANKLEKLSADLITTYLKDKNNQDLRMTIKQRINLAEFLSFILPSFIIKTIRVAASFYQTNGISSEVVLNLIDLHRPDLVKVIRESQENLIWFKRQVHDVKRLFGIS